MNLSKINTDVLISELEKRGYLRVLLHKNDILSQARDMDISLSKEHLQEVADDLVHKYNTDAEIGLIIENALWNFLDKYKQLNK
jgi:hypothetical protein